jgi:aminoglycoside phosphotransferase (APT) family kinase protein
MRIRFCHSLVVKDSSTQFNRIYNILEQLHGQAPRGLRLQVKALRGGLEALAVLRVQADFQDSRGRRQTSFMAVKRLDGSRVREASVYQKLVVRHAQAIAPCLLAVDEQGTGHSTLYLEWVRPVTNWPWRELSTAEQFIGRLARLHMSTAADDVAAALPQWNYDSELRRSGETTLDLLARCRRHPEFAPLARLLPPARHLTEALPELRQQLLAYTPLGRVAIHGDVHPGNVLVRRRAGNKEPILIDWGRARSGSPLEDLSSWLQSLSYWEPRARLRHDTLLGSYLSARGMERRLTSDLRAAYWLAGASNALSGALQYHLSLLVGQTPARPSRIPAAARSARDWLRIVRRAAACWH